MKVGFHAIRPEFDALETSDFSKFSNYYDILDSCINVFASKNSKVSALRLHYFYATKDEVEFLRTRKINRLLSSDDERISYSLPMEANQILLQNNSIHHNGMNFRRTNLRMEKMTLPPLDLRSMPNDTIVFFTHESRLKSKKSKLLFEYCLWFFYKNNCAFNFI